MIPVGEWFPDLPAFQNPGALEAKNVIPAALSYRPFPAFSSVTGALTARAQGAFTCRDLSGGIHNFAGDATKLYKLSSDGLTWNDVSKTMTTYATAADGRWSFTQFGNFVIATNLTDAPQYYELGTSSLFADLAGSPPSAAFATTVGDFVWLGRVASANNQVRWSAINDPESWTVSATTLADYQDFPDGGWVMGVTGGETPLVFQERSIRRATFIGPPLIYQFDVLSKEIGCVAEGTVAAYERDAFFLSDSGFYRIAAGAQLEPIGDQKVNRHFLSDVDQSYLYRITSAIDPVNKLYVVSYPGTGNTSGTPNKALIYNWSVGRWSRAEFDAEMIYAAAQQSGYTLDGLDSVNASLDALAFSLDSRVWSGSGKLLLSGFDTSHKSGFFNGSNLTATVDTGEFQLIKGQRSFVTSIRPMVDGGTVTVAPIIRNLQTEGETVGTAVSVNSVGVCPLRSNARYHRARLTVSGDSWTDIQGVDDIRATPAGTQ